MEVGALIMVKDPTSTERQRLCRERRRGGRKLVLIEVDFEMCDGLVDAGWLKFQEFEDRESIKRAVERLLASLAGGGDVTRDRVKKLIC